MYGIVLVNEVILVWFLADLSGEHIRFSAFVFNDMVTVISDPLVLFLNRKRYVTLCPTLGLSRHRFILYITIEGRHKFSLLSID
jgi:hypothetical protein